MVGIILVYNNNYKLKSFKVGKTFFKRTIYFIYFFFLLEETPIFRANFYNLTIKIKMFQKLFSEENLCT